MVDKVIALLSGENGKVGETTVKRDKIHEYLGMTLDFSEESQFIVNMEEYINEILIGLPEDINGVATTPAADHLFKTQTRKEPSYFITSPLRFYAWHNSADLIYRLPYYS